MTKQELIREILDAATSNDLSKAEKAIDEYVRRLIASKVKSTKDRLIIDNQTGAFAD